jgi:hypothetical protein
MRTESLALCSLVHPSQITSELAEFHKILYEGHSYLILIGLLTNEVGRAIAQAVSRRIPTAGARVRAQVSSCGICGG